LFESPLKRYLGPPSEITPPAANPRRLWVQLIPFALVAIVLTVYSNSLRGPFIGDDFPAIVNNPDIHSLPTSLRAIHAHSQTSVSGRPVVSFSLAINYAFHGLSVRGFHAVNIGIHLTTALLLFGLIRRTPAAESGKKPGIPVLLAGAATAIWAVHPLHTETVNYAVQRTELLVGCFFVLMLYAVARGSGSRRSRAWSILAVVACALGVMSKEVMAAGPLVALLYDYTFFAGSIRTALSRRAGLYAGLCGCWVLLGAITLGGPRGASVGFAHGVGWWDYLLTQSTVITHYLSLAFWPARLVISYHDWPIADGVLAVLPQAAMLTAALFGSTTGMIRRRWWGFLGVSFFLILAPSSSVVPIVTELAAERRMYLPLIALVLVAGAGLLRAAGVVAWVGIGARVRALSAVAVALILTLGATTWARNRDYQDEVSIWTDAARKRPNNAVAHGGVAYALKQAGDLPGALKAATEAVRIDPDYVDGRFYLANVLQLLGRDSEAITAYGEVLRLDGQYEDALYNLSLVLEKTGRFAEAVSDLERLTATRPDHGAARRLLTACLARLGRNHEALEHASRAVALEPNRADARYNLAVLLTQTGADAAAVEHFEALLALQPDDVEARFLLGEAFERLGDKAAAIREYRLVLRGQPGHAGARPRLAALRGE